MDLPIASPLENACSIKTGAALSVPAWMHAGPKALLGTRYERWMNLGGSCCNSRGSFASCHIFTSPILFLR